MNLDRSEDTGAPLTNNTGAWRRPGPSCRPPGSTSTPLPAPTTGSGATMTHGNSNAPEPNSNRYLGLDRPTNLDQMGGIRLFFSQPIWPENMLLGQVGQLGGEGAGCSISGICLGCVICDLHCSGGVVGRVVPLLAFL